MLGFTLVFIALFTSFSYPIKADDIWWHLGAGKLISENWTLPDQNIFSFTAPEHAWLPQEWLSDLIFYLVFEFLGPRGLIALGVALNTLACALVFRLTERYTRSPLASSAITLIALLMMLSNFSLRPYLFGNLFFLTAIHMMEEPAAGGRLRPALVFLLFLSWANFHASFIIGLALILLYAAASSATHIGEPGRAFRVARPLLRDFLTALLASAVTPNHIYGLVFPLTYLNDALQGKTVLLTNLSDWQAASLDSPQGRMILFFLFFCGFAVAGSATWLSAVHLGLLIAFALFAFTSIRNIPLLGIAAAPLLARHLPGALARSARLLGDSSAARALRRCHSAVENLERRSQRGFMPALLGLVLLCLFALPPALPFSYPSLTGVHELADLSPAFYPAKLLKVLRERGTEDRIFNYYDWGGAFLWELYPRARVFIDQRNACYPEEVLLDYFTVHERKPGWRWVLDRWEIDAIAYPKGEPLTEYLRSDLDWLVAYEDEQAVLFVRLAVSD